MSSSQQSSSQGPKSVNANSHDRGKKGFEHLKRDRKRDLVEEYQQDIETYAHSYIPPAESSSSSSSEEENNLEDGRSSQDIAFRDQPSAKFAKIEYSEPSAAGGIGMQLMKKVGYKEGSGLGRSGQGIVNPIEAFNQHGRVGLGHEASKALAPGTEFEIDTQSEIKSIEEKPLWVECDSWVRDKMRRSLNLQWIVESKPKKTIDDEDRYCSRELIAELINCKNVFNYLDSRTLNEARARANPYETVKAGFFQNRAAMKTANVDKIYDWRLSRDFDRGKRLAKNPLDKESDRTNADRLDSTFYFADVCAGPGGFSEYMLWRKAYYNAKGFGFTLKNADDFKLWKFRAAPSEYFETYYGEKGDGNVMDPKNLFSLENFVKARTHGSEGVHLVMCDGGFSVEGQENIQEILSKRLYLCQSIVGLSLCRMSGDGKSGGNFFCKLFDIFTPFSMGLIYLLYLAFEKISLHKPLTSRPANSERYIFCENLTEMGATVIKEYLVEVNNRLEKFAENKRKDLEDIYELVPEEVIQQDEKFFNYVVEHNQSVIKRQIFYLKKYRLYAQNKGSYDSDQGRIREDCLNYWELPNIDRTLDNSNNKCPANITLRKLTGEHIRWQNLRTPAFNLDLLKQATEKHLPSAELRAQLMPECSEPQILVTAGGNDMTCYDRAGRGEKFFMPNSLLLPRDTILLIQKAEKYDENMKPVGQIIYVLDAAVLNGDDVSDLPFRARLNAAKKFCAVVNKVDFNLVDSAAKDRNKRDHVPTTTPVNERNREKRDKKEFKTSTVARSELIVAEPMRLKTLFERTFKTKLHKGAQAAVVDIVGESSYKMLCRGVRFVNILRPNWRIFWSKTSKEEYLFDHTRNITAKISEVRPDTNSTFYDCFNSMAHTNRMPDDTKRRESRAFVWTWDAGYNRDFSVLNILHDESHASGITVKALIATLDDETKKIEFC